MKTFFSYCFVSRNPQVFESIESDVKNILLPKFKQLAKNYAEFTQETHNKLLPKFDNLHDLNLFKQKYLMPEKTIENTFKSCESCENKFEADKMFTCGNCQIAMYCSVVCQRNDWSRGHYKICIKFGELNKSNREELNMKIE